MLKYEMAGRSEGKASNSLGVERKEKERHEVKVLADHFKFIIHLFVPNMVPKKDYLRQLVGDELCTPREAPRSSWMGFCVCNCVHPNCTSFSSQIVFYTPSYLCAATCSLLNQSSHCRMEFWVTRTSLGYLDFIRLVWKGMLFNRVACLVPRLTSYTLLGHSSF